MPITAMTKTSSVNVKPCSRVHELRIFLTLTPSTRREGVVLALLLRARAVPAASARADREKTPSGARIGKDLGLRAGERGIHDHGLLPQAVRPHDADCSWVRGVVRADGPPGATLRRLLEPADGKPTAVVGLFLGSAPHAR
jgi:hypothetical protein